MTESTEKVARRRGRPSKDEAVVSREELLTEAFRQFATRGYDSVSLRKLAADIGVSDSLFHHYFGSKTELWREAVEKELAPQTDALIQQLRDSTDSDHPAENLRRNISEALHMTAKNPITLLMLFQENDTKTERGQYLYDKFLTPYFDLVDEAFNGAKAQNVIKDVPLMSIHALVTGAARILVEPGLTRERSSDVLNKETGIEKFIDGCVDIIFDGMLLHPKS